MTLDRILRASHSGRRGEEALVEYRHLLRLLTLRDEYDEMLGRLAAAMQVTEGWRSLGFSSFAEYCEERLGMDVSDVERLAARARRAHRLRSADVRG